MCYKIQIIFSDFDNFHTTNAESILLTQPICMKNILRNVLFVVLASSMLACQNKPTYDTIISQGMLYDGSGGEPVVTDIGIIHDTIAAIGDLSKATAREVVNAKGKAVAPGFINMMGHSEETFANPVLAL